MGVLNGSAGRLTLLTKLPSHIPPSRFCDVRTYKDQLKAMSMSALLKLAGYLVTLNAESPDMGVE